jgi:anti-sigma factor RsiW
VSAAAAVAAVVLAGGGWALFGSWGASARENALVREVIGSHNNSLPPGPSLDVQSSEAAAVRKWLERRLSFTPVVPDLTREGFELVGGRLDLGGVPAAAVVYRVGPHVLHLMARRGIESIPVGEIRLQEQQGRRVARWTLACLDFWVACDIHVPEQDLLRFVGLVRKATPPHSPPRFTTFAQ